MRSTIQRLGKTTKRCRSERLTICNVHAPVRLIRLAHLRPGVAAVTYDPFDEGKASAGVAQQRFRSIPVLNVGGMDLDAQQQAKRVDEDVTLAPEDLLARVITGRIKRGPPFSAPLALCASMMAVVGLASRPAASRL